MLLINLLLLCHLYKNKPQSISQLSDDIICVFGDMQLCQNVIANFKLTVDICVVTRGSVLSIIAFCE